MQVKSNQEVLFDEVILACKRKPIFKPVTTVDKGHGRIEFRTIRVFNFSAANWNVSYAIKITKQCETKINGKYRKSKSVRFYVATHRMNAEEYATSIRQHWLTENSNHYVRDVALLEDSNRIRIKPENMMIIRSFGYNIIRANKTKSSFSAQVEHHKRKTLGKLIKSNGVIY